MTARALGQGPAPLHWRGLAVLPTRTHIERVGADAAQVLAGFAAKLGPALRPPLLLPAALPEVPQIASGAAAQFYDLDYRDVGRLIYAPQRDAIEGSSGSALPCTR